MSAQDCRVLLQDIDSNPMTSLQDDRETVVLTGPKVSLHGRALQYSESVFDLRAFELRDWLQDLADKGIGPAESYNGRAEFQFVATECETLLESSSVF